MLGQEGALVLACGETRLELLGTPLELGFPGWETESWDKQALRGCLATQAGHLTLSLSLESNSLCSVAL